MKKQKLLDYIYNKYKQYYNESKSCPELININTHKMTLLIDLHSFIQKQK